MINLNVFDMAVVHEKVHICPSYLPPHLPIIMWILSVAQSDCFWLNLHSQTTWSTGEPIVFNSDIQVVVDRIPTVIWTNKKDAIHIHFRLLTTDIRPMAQVYCQAQLSPALHRPHLALKLRYLTWQNVPASTPAVSNMQQHALFICTYKTCIVCQWSTLQACECDSEICASIWYSSHVSWNSEAIVEL